MLKLTYIFSEQSYLEYANTIKVEHTSNVGNVTIHFQNDVDNDGEFKDGATCNITIGQKVKFRALIKAEEHLLNVANFRIFPVGLDQVKNIIISQ